jgi:hypothetical protein
MKGAGPLMIGNISNHFGGTSACRFGFIKKQNVQNQKHQWTRKQPAQAEDNLR